MQLIQFHLVHLPSSRTRLHSLRERSKRTRKVKLNPLPEVKGKADTEDDDVQEAKPVILPVKTEATLVPEVKKTDVEATIRAEQAEQQKEVPSDLVKGRPGGASA